MREHFGADRLHERGAPFYNAISSVWLKIPLSQLNGGYAYPMDHGGLPHARRGQILANHMAAGQAWPQHLRKIAVPIKRKVLQLRFAMDSHTT
jgi:hypothetical protein